MEMVDRWRIFRCVDKYNSQPRNSFQYIRLEYIFLFYIGK